LRGADEMLPVLASKLGCGPGETSADGMFTLETVMCLAACDRAPLMQVNLEYHEDLTESRIDELLARLRESGADPSAPAPRASVTESAT
jgi:NADH:ubiquinone oxidoreductase subunit E